MRFGVYGPASVAGLGVAFLWIVTGGAVTTALVIGAVLACVLVGAERLGEVKGPRA